MKTEPKILSMFTKIDTYEDCPVGVDLLTWNGCDFNITYVDVDVDTGSYYDANDNDFFAYIELCTQDEAAQYLGETA